MRKFSILLTTLLILVLLIALVWLMPSRPTLLSFSLGSGIALLITIYFASSLIYQRKNLSRGAFWIPVISLSLLGIILPFFIAAALYSWGIFSFLTWALVIGLTLTFFFNFLNIPLSLYHKQYEAKIARIVLDRYPPITVLVPAYNEEKVLARSLESIINARYPNKEIIVIDDGSDDQTFAIALKYGNRGVTVIRRPNGGKSSALNYGLHFAKGEIIICVDADSVITKNALIDLVKMFDDPRVGAVAGNVKVLNQTNLVTKCQALEYLISIELFRRALDVFGQVGVVPGALGAYRRQLLMNVGSYDRDTLVEDFDITLKVLKYGALVLASSSALAYTEAPTTVADLAKQRLRWYRGNFQAIWKHRDAAWNRRYGLLQRLTYPYLIISMLVLPLAGIIVIVSAILSIINGMTTELIYIFIFFVILQFLISLLSIELDGDDNINLLLYSPLFVVGYKHFCDFTIIKSLFDVIFRRDLVWGRARRIG